MKESNLVEEHESGYRQKWNKGQVLENDLEVEWRKPEIKKEGGSISFPERTVSSKQGYRKNFQSTEKEILKVVRREGVENPKIISTLKVRRRAENFRN